MPTHGTLTSILQRLTHAGPRGARTHRARSAARTCRAAALGRIMGVSAAARDPPTAAAAVQRVAEESEELGRILRIEARPLKQAVWEVQVARRAHRSSILSSSRTPDQLRVPRSEHLVHFSRRRCFEHNQRPEHLTCRRPRLDVARRAHPWPGTWCTYRRSQYERYSLAVTSDGKVGPSGVVLRPLSGPGGDNVSP